ncbi:uncharacterized protein B0P05DRAFT_568290 [Gilbertella persicaria]|uniref:uncharacterized protein n=1 Tax=Gilbertella persicaria TaxID=101096 RepID=UPI00221FBA8E|nr:uncharacterized protein B0P05DRAFT_568290 [Gilbertella persicaria]KAI8095097.1 hypothetical protein B0P05DRAFT_568290 [Gilbertella persicaria]
MACAGQCTPNTSFTAADGCNQCYCPASGLISDAACTERLCIPSEDRCTPGETFMATDGCNRCICPANGLAWGAACTLMACIVEPSILVDPIPISLIPISTTL